MSIFPDNFAGTVFWTCTFASYQGDTVIKIYIFLAYLKRLLGKPFRKSQKESCLEKRVFNARNETCEMDYHCDLFESAMIAAMCLENL